jgi:hypothetical protein
MPAVWSLGEVRAALAASEARIVEARALFGDADRIRGAVFDRLPVGTRLAHRYAAPGAAYVVELRADGCWYLDVEMRVRAAWWVRDQWMGRNWEILEADL